MTRSVEITEQNLERIDFGGVVALFFSQSGAAGESGTIKLHLADGSTYRLNYNCGPVSLEQFHRVFPQSPTNQNHAPEVWHEINLEMGHLLFLHDQAYQRYLEDHDSSFPEDVVGWWRSVEGKPLLSRQERYRWLVNEVKNAYPQEPTGAVNEFIWCKDCQDEINLWTYWQGQGCLEPEILLVGQDWGNPDSPVGVKCLQNIRNRRPYMEDNSFPSDIHLAELFQKALNIDISKKCEQLFFTNLVLGYRTGKNTGELKATQFSHDLGFFKTLVNILQPKVVVCLGEKVFTYALRAYGERVPFIGKYNDALNDRNNHVEIEGIHFIGMSHCGNYGCKNRVGVHLRGMEQQIEDWKEISRYR